tara:strand:- start:304 stop:441 length:138 start_codon:yes stop_codon:yes gene_type:complete
LLAAQEAAAVKNAAAAVLAVLEDLENLLVLQQVVTQQVQLRAVVL